LDRQLTLVRVRQHFGNGYAILVLMQRPCVIAGEIALLTNQPRRATVRPPPLSSLVMLTWRVPSSSASADYFLC
jgi:hypothetical protein